MPSQSLTEAQRDKLQQLARAEAKNAYAPYSKFAVGAALVSEAGKYYVGANVENASYGLTMCAERSAVFSAVASEGASMKVDAIAIYGEGADYTPPCGACRQVLAEFGPNCIIMFGGRKGWKETRLGNLLPERFEMGDR